MVNKDIINEEKKKESIKEINMNNNVIFQTWEFQKEDLFIKIEYKFEKKEKNKKYSWNIFRKSIIPTLKQKENEFQLVENLGKGNSKNINKL